MNLHHTTYIFGFFIYIHVHVAGHDITVIPLDLHVKLRLAGKIQHDLHVYTPGANPSSLHGIIVMIASVIHHTNHIHYTSAL